MSTLALPAFQASAINPPDHIQQVSRSQQGHDLSAFKTAPSRTDDGRHSLPSIDSIPRPSEISQPPPSLHHSSSLPQLPGLSALASIASGRESPILRYVSAQAPTSVFFKSAAILVMQCWRFLSIHARSIVIVSLSRQPGSWQLFLSPREWKLTLHSYQQSTVHDGNKR